MRGMSIQNLMKARGPELVLEAIFVVFAVLVALAVDEWNEGRELREQADRAQTAVIAELEANRAELRIGLESTDEMLQGVISVVGQLRAGEPVEDYDLSGVLPDFSDAAWETARVTGTVNRMDYDWVLSTARLYETHELAQDLQRDLFIIFGSMAVRELELERTLDLLGQLAVLNMIFRDLDGKYAEVFGQDVEEQGELPDSVSGPVDDSSSQGS